MFVTNIGKGLFDIASTTPLAIRYSDGSRSAARGQKKHNLRPCVTAGTATVPPGGIVVILAEYTACDCGTGCRRLFKFSQSEILHTTVHFCKSATFLELCG